MRKVSARTVVVSAIGMAAGWILLVGGTHLEEMLVGAVVIAASMTLLVRVLQQQALEMRFRWKHVLQVWRVPWYMLQSCATITWVLLKDLAGHRAGSYYRAVGFRTSAHDPEAIGRSILATLYTSISPNFIVIGIDPSRSLMLFHQIERAEVHAMAKALGAQEGLPG